MRNFLIIYGIALLCCISCSSFVDVDQPKNQLTSGTIYTNIKTAEAVVLNIYSRFETTIDPSLVIHLNTYADDLIDPSSSGIALEFFQGKLSTTNSTNNNIWTRLYAIIYQCNTVLQNVQDNPDFYMVQLSREALFMRAFAYFYLVNLYGDVPLILDTDINVNAKAERTSKETIYRQLMDDLKKARNELPLTYANGSKARASSLAASALMARIALYEENWELADQYASEVIESGKFSLVSSQEINEVFLADNKEAVFQLATPNGWLSVSNSIIPRQLTNLPQFRLTSDLIAQFDPNDLRFSNWTGVVSSTPINMSPPDHYLYKYKSRSDNPIRKEHLSVFRLAELYLIRAEARAMKGNLTDAGDDLGILWQRAGIVKTKPNNIINMLAAIRRERRLELFMEGNHRFFDLKRWGILEEVIGEQKPLWNVNSSLLPIPESEITKNIRLVQNPGY